ncbi:MAG: hypothetical protein QN716_06675, partial [Nitrososphaeraceae archaeon]|nr:hypothetical protein [Nitrososphaeraceae archaeon]
MTLGKYFNKGVSALDAPDIGHVVRETPDKIVVFGGGDERYDIPISEIQQVGANVLIGLRIYDIITKYKVSRQQLLPTSRQDPWTGRDRIDLATYEKEYPKSLFNKGVRAKNEDHVGHVMKETNEKIVVFGQSNFRFDIPKSHIIAAGRNVILNMDFPEIFQYQVNKNAALPTGEPLKIVNKEAYPTGHSKGRGASRRVGYPQQERDRETSKSIYIQDDKKQKTSESITDMIMGNSYSNIKSSSSSTIEAGIEV